MATQGYNFDLASLEGITLKGNKLSVGEAYEVAGQIMHLASTGKITPNPLPLGFAIGPGNTYQQAWAAVLAGHQIRQPDWPTDMSWVFERNHQELLRVYGDTHEDWTRTGAIVLPTGSHQLFENWEVLPIIDFETPTV